MNIITSNNLAPAAVPAQQAYSNSLALPSTGEAGPSSRAPPLEGLRNTFSDNARDSLFAKTKDMKDSGASDNDIKSFVEIELANNSRDSSDDAQRSGRLIDILV